MKKLHRVLSTVKTIHKDKTADMLRGWLFSDNYTQLCQKSRQSIRTTQQTCWGMIVQWQHRVLSTVKTIHEDTTQQTHWLDDCSVTTQGSVNSQDNPWRHNTADILTGWLFSNNTGSVHSQGNPWRHNTADRLIGWLFTDSYTQLCQQSRQSMRTTQQTCWLDDCSVTTTQSSVNSPVLICLQWMHTQPINFVTTHTNKSSNG